MRALIPAVALLVTATSTSAAPEKVVDLGDTVYYVDPASVSDVGGVHRAPVVQDYANTQPAGVRSRRVEYEIDCANQRLRSVAGSEYAEPMARGTATSSWQRQSDWLYVTPRTGSHIASSGAYRPIVRFVCSQ